MACQAGHGVPDAAEVDGQPGKTLYATIALPGADHRVSHRAELLASRQPDGKQAAELPYRHQQGSSAARALGQMPR